MKIVFAGAIGRFPTGGHAWCEMNYLAGLTALGHEVYYVEECGDGSWVYDWEAQEVTSDVGYPTRYLAASLEAIGLGRRWSYRAGDECVGMSLQDVTDVCASADVFFIRGCAIPRWRREYLLPRTTVFVDGDPGFTQIAALGGDRALAETIGRADRLFTFGQQLGTPHCDVPTGGRVWEPTLQPVHLPSWPVAPGDPAAPFSTVMQWRSYRGIEYEGQHYGNKDRTFPPFSDMPARTGTRLLVALTGGDTQELAAEGWEVVPGWRAVRTPDDYQAFIRASAGEFSVAKEGYVGLRTGWFGDRSACYLALGRPVVVQDTGLHGLAEDGGVLLFAGPEEAAAAVLAVREEYERHAAAARRLAEDRFASERVLPALLDSW